ncbi:MAG: sigma 54-interacting transcriptional regulator [Minicystis sp.]
MSATVHRQGANEDERLELVVITPELLVTFPLPPSGSLSIGRSEGNDVQIDDASVSRRHAVLHVGPPLAIEDLGSANGIRVRRAHDQPRTTELVEVKAEKHATVPVAIGDGITLGSAVLMVRRAEGGAQGAEGDFIVLDEAMKKLHELAARVAQGPISVMLLGETGVGKEVLAEVVHRRSPRRDGPFLRLNCAALSESLLESELFGHEKGAFTGAAAAKPGLLETAEGGTVFLDEVGELSPSIQVKFLRVLEERKVTRVGGLTARPLDVRFVSATNRDPEAEVKKGAFRQDLLFRLNGITLTIPPLRERPQEIEPLSRMFAARAAAKMGRPAPALTREALTALKQHGWRGNVRELRNVMERAVVLAEAGAIAVEHLLLPVAPEPVAAATTARIDARAKAGGGAHLRSELAAIERQRILDALDACAGNQTHAAAMLGMARRTLVGRLAEYGIPRPRKR